MRNSAFLALGLILLFVQENMFRLPELPWTPPALGHPSLLLPLLLFMGIRDFSLVRGACLSFVLGYATDLLGMSPIGLFTFTSVMVFVLARAAGFRVASRSRWVQVLVTFAFSIAQSAMTVILMAVFSPQKDAWAVGMRMRAVLPHALVTSLVALPILALADFVLGRMRRDNDNGARLTHRGAA